MQGFDGETGTLGRGCWRSRAIAPSITCAPRTAGCARSVQETAETEFPALFANLETELVSSDQVRRIREALTKLNENQRTVIELAYFEGLSQSEMAGRLGHPLGTIKTWMRTALRNLRGELEGGVSR